MSFNCRRVQIFEDLMGLLRVRWVALVGPSNGGPTAAAFAVRKPTTVTTWFSTVRSPPTEARIRLHA
jgi:hypothetical protein